MSTELHPRVVREGESVNDGRQRGWTAHANLTPQKFAESIASSADVPGRVPVGKINDDHTFSDSQLRLAVDGGKHQRGGDDSRH
jgi:hypothetical protein